MTFEEWWNETGQETLYALNTLTDADAKILAKIAWESASAQPVKQEPVAWWEFNEDIGAWLLAYTFNPKAKTRPLIFGDIAPVDAKAIRAEALEEAAKWFEANGANMMTKDECAAAIRGLK